MERGAEAAFEVISHIVRPIRREVAFNRARISALLELLGKRDPSIHCGYDKRLRKVMIRDVIAFEYRMALSEERFERHFRS